MSSQNHFFDVDSVREIRLYFYDTSWDYILDSLYVLGNNDRLLADIVIDGTAFINKSINQIKSKIDLNIQ